MKRLSIQEIDQIIILYKQGVSPTEIGKKYNIFSNSVNRIIRRHDSTLTKTKKINNEIKQQIVKMYQEGISSEAIAKKYNINASTVCRILKKLNIKLRSSEENKRKYKINTNFFEKIDNEAKAYFLGFLYADGFVSNNNDNKNYYQISICLSSKDRDILEKFSTLIYNFDKIKDFSKKSYNSEQLKNYSQISIYSKKMHHDLVKLGCVPNKSLTLIFPNQNQIPDYLMHHFIRGYFDGDGCLSRGIKYVVDITSSQDFLLGMIDYLNKKININFNKLQQRHKDRDTSTRSVQITKLSNIITFLSYLYKDSTIYLLRKRQYFEEMLSKNFMDYIPILG